jgi:MerR family transcriptional regulator/heat shock protein HspR
LGVNLAGVEEIIRLRQKLDVLQQRIEDRIESIQERLQLELKGARALPAPADRDDGALAVGEDDEALRRGLEHLQDDG